MRALVCGALILTACGGSSKLAPGPLRFRVAPPVMLVNDRLPIAQPKKDSPGLVEYYLREDLIAPARETMTVRDPRPAQNVNSLGDVPDSSWFTHRHLTAEEIQRGPGIGGPEPSQPWSVVGVKVGGAAIGITIKDSRGDKYVLKFDEEGFPETETGADIVVQRLTWAFGYNVPDNQVVTFKREQLVMDPDAKYANGAGGSRPMTEADLDRYLGMAERSGDTYRALASKFIAGKIIGGIEPSGVRADDPNDRVPHELRRDLRGQRVLWAWVNHIDLKSQNTLATYDDNHVTWYAIDFGESLGVAAHTDGIPRLGYQTKYSLRELGKSLVMFGLYVHPWERRHPHVRYRGLGDFDSETFDPAAWVPDHDWRPTDVADRYDQLWGAEILMRFTRADIEAAVTAASYSDQRAADYIVTTLLARQRELGQWAFSRVAPLTDLSASEHGKQVEVCFADLWLRYAYGTVPQTHYRATAFDYDGHALGATTPLLAATSDHGCVAVPAATTRDDGYTIVRLDVVRAEPGDPDDLDAMRPLFVHVARLPSGAFAVIGLDRR